MAKKRRLSDLYRRGKEVTFDDGEGAPIVVYLKKLNDIDHGRAVRRANAARSRVLCRTDEFSEIYDSVTAEIFDLTVEDLVDELTNDDVARKNAVIEAQHAALEEWADESYLQGLQDSWEEDLYAVWVKDPEDPEAKRVFEELKRFAAEVDEELEAYGAQMRADWESKSEEALREEVIQRRIKQLGDVAWLQEFRRCEVWLSLYEADKTTRYFQARDEVDDLSPAVLIRLVREYQEIAVDPLEGKDSAASPDSSSSSEPPESPEEAPSSGLEAVLA
jgi:hypothetical protein